MMLPDYKVAPTDVDNMANRIKNNIAYIMNNRERTNEQKHNSRHEL